MIYSITGNKNFTKAEIGYSEVLHQYVLDLFKDISVHNPFIIGSLLFYTVQYGINQY